MGFFEKIGRFVGTTSALQSGVEDALASAYSATARNARCLRHLAELAPQPASAHALTELAESEEAVSRRFAEALHAGARKLPPIDAHVELEPSNHWGRLVQILEAQRKLV